MTARKMMLAGALSLTGLWSAAWGQVPVVPVVPPPPGAAPVVPVAAVPAQPNTLWSFLGISKPQIRECILKKCNTPCGQFGAKMVAPLTMFSGGIVPPLCPLVPTAAELADQGVVGEAAKIKAEEAGAKARKAAVRYLGTVDCSRFPDAEGALIKALRTDTNECVRFEAALALGNGCCCTKATMEALSIAGSCSDRDGNPREYSDRVRAAAVSALQNCLSCYVDPTPKQEKIIEGKEGEGRTVPVPPLPVPPLPVPPPEEVKKIPDTKTAKADDAEAKPATRPTGMAYYAKISQVPRQMIVDEARKVVDNFNQVASTQAILSRQTSLVSIVNNAFDNRQMVMAENGAPVMLASGQPNTLWDVLTRQTSPTESMLSPKAEVMVKNSDEPPAMVVQIEPLPTKVIKVEPTPLIVTKPEPAPLVFTKPEPINANKSDSTKITKSDPMNFTKSDATNSTKLEPMNVIKAEPTKVMKTDPMNVIKAEPMNAIKSEPTKTMKPEPMNVITAEPMNVTKSEPLLPVLPKPESMPLPPVMLPSGDPLKSSLPRETKVAKSGPYGEQMGNKPKTPAELASMPRGGMSAISDMTIPAPLPATVTKEPIKIDRQVMKPLEPKEVAKPTVTALAQRALTVMTDNHPSIVRESIADTLAVVDLTSSPELVSALVNEAKGKDSDGARNAAIRALVRCRINSPTVMTALEKLQEEAVPAVRAEAAIGLARLRLLNSK